jgi:hypothetical protein
MNESAYTACDQTLRRKIGHSCRVLGGFSLLYIAFFAPVLFTGRLLAPGDGLIYYLPAFYAPNHRWTDLIFGGYPLMGDSQNMTWYLPAMLLRWLPNTWNAFVILAYVLAGSFAYCYAYILTGSCLAATVGGLVYSLSGFMMAHLGHVTIIHAAAWIPLYFCALERLRQSWSIPWLIVGSLAITCSFLGGHPQIAIYGLSLGGIYAGVRGWQAPTGRWRYYRGILGIFGLGLLLCSVQILPAIEFSHLTNRALLTFEQFASLSLPVEQILQVLFPYLFGGPFLFSGLGSGPYQLPYWGRWNLAEITGYMGLLPLMLAAIGMIAAARQRHLRPIVVFWGLTGLVALLLALGDGTVLSHLLYAVPPYNQFRAQGRHLMEVTLACSVLAALGVAAIEAKWASRRLIWGTVGGGLLVMLLSLWSIWHRSGHFQAAANQVGIRSLSLWPGNNPAIVIPLLIFGGGALVLLLWSNRRRQRWKSWLLITVLVLDLSSFGWFWEWQLRSPSRQMLVPNQTVQLYRSRLRLNHQRFFTLNAVTAALINPFQTSDLAQRKALQDNAIFPNMTRLWALPSADGYSPFILTRVAEMLRMGSDGSLSELPINPQNRGLDLMAVKYLLVPRTVIDRTMGGAALSSDRATITWSQADLGLVIGAGGCMTLPSHSTVQIDFEDRDQTATAIGLVSALGCAVQLPNNAAVAQVQVTDFQGKVEQHSVLAGRDTAETAYDCPDVQPRMQHQRAPIYQDRPGARCRSYEYVSLLQLKRPQSVRQLTIKLTHPMVMLRLSRISLFDQHTKQSRSVQPMELNPQWQPVEQSPSGMIYQNQQALPRAWLVAETIPLTSAQVLQAIQTSQLPNGSVYQPQRMALVEDTKAMLHAPTLQSTDHVQILDLGATQIRLQTHAAASTFLVLSDVFYPGWQATIDGQPTQIFPTNYVQRGVQVPAGEHLVEYRFEPWSFKLGASISLVSGLGAALALWWRNRVKHRQSSAL